MKERILNHVLGQLDETKPLTLSRLETAEIPDSIRHFLDRAIRRRVNQELEGISIPESAWIDSSGDGVRQASVTLVERLRESGRLPSEELRTYTHRAVDTVTDYVSRPVDTLIRFLFPEGAERARPADLQRRSAYFSAFPHLIGTVGNVASSSDGHEDGITREHLEKRLRGADRAAGSGLDTDGWMSLLRPLTELLLLAAPDGATVDVRPVLAFVRDKRHVELTATLTPLVASSDSMTLAALHVAFQQALQPAPPPVPGPTPQSGKTESPAQQNGPAESKPLWQQFVPSADSSASESGSEPAASEPLWKAFAHGEKPTAERVSKEPDPPHEKSETPASESGEISLSFDDLEQRVLGGAASLRSSFIEKLFRGDEPAYLGVIQRLSRSAGWEQSAEILKTHVFTKFRVDIYSESAIAFTNAIERRIKQFS